MAARSITTSQPAVACDVCGRNLLRGEHSGTFLDGGHRRRVCELCVTRATQEGWRREGDEHSLDLTYARGKRARTLMSRLRHRRDEGELPAVNYEPAAPVRRPYGAEEPELVPGAGEQVSMGEELDGYRDPTASPPVASTRRPPRPGAGGTSSVRGVRQALRSVRSVHAVPSGDDQKAARALEVFNAGDQPRRVAGVARSLGVPAVVTRTVVSGATLVSIVVAWELCWYRYEIDLGDEHSGARLVAQGLELDELADADLTANAVADEHGELHMLAP
jgi:hypothetical protein